MDDLEIFITVVDEHGFSAAADRLKTTTASISSRVKALEQRLGVRLLQRTTRKVQLTEAGERYYLEAHCLLVDLKTAEDQLQQVTHEPVGELRIAAPMSFGQRRLAASVPRLAAAHPRLRVTLRLDVRETDLIGEGIDLALRIAYPFDSYWHGLDNDAA